MYQQPSPSGHQTSDGQSYRACADASSAHCPLDQTELVLPSVTSPADSLTQEIMVSGPTKACLKTSPETASPLDHRHDTTIRGTRNLIARAALAANTAMTLSTAALAAMTYQLTQAHCFECWSTRLLPCAALAALAGFICKKYDTVKSRAVAELKVLLRSKKSTAKRLDED